MHGLGRDWRGGWVCLGELVGTVILKQWREEWVEWKQFWPTVGVNGIWREFIKHFAAFESASSKVSSDASSGLAFDAMVVSSLVLNASSALPRVTVG
ncbi:hypothetical protein FRX31_002871 [Thalictrum thalictroides]|uniref:Uncharacterized protein n=1 Tax=Thalictrum thalictroides TaxID=46969 RepID=A0A7J6XG84_THATH|nr:hypothetical protein FRX31_002871 [Thalictrum thalictroides]